MSKELLNLLKEIRSTILHLERERLNGNNPQIPRQLEKERKRLAELKRRLKNSGYQVKDDHLDHSLEEEPAERESLSFLDETSRGSINTTVRNHQVPLDTESDVVPLAYTSQPTKLQAGNQNQNRPNPLDSFEEEIISIPQGENYAALRNSYTNLEAISTFLKTLLEKVGDEYVIIDQHSHIWIPHLRICLVIIESYLKSESGKNKHRLFVATNELSKAIKTLEHKPINTTSARASLHKSLTHALKML